MTALARATADAGKQYRALAKDQQAFSQAQAGAGGRYKDINKDQEAFAAGVARTGQAMAQGFNRLSQVGQTTFGALAGGVAGFITAGMQGTAESNQLGQAIKEVNLQVASIFTPQIHKAIDAIQRLVYWLRELTGQQQDSARQWIAGAAALSGFLSLMGGRGLPGVSAIPLVGGALSSPLGALAGLAAASEEGRKALLDLAEASLPLVKSFAILAPAMSKFLAGVIKVTAWLAETL